MNKKSIKEKTPLSEYFDAESDGENWNLFCKQCSRGWSLPKKQDHPGNLLFLLNHAGSHAKLES